MLGAPRHDGDPAAARAHGDQDAAAPSSPRGLVLACAGLLHRGDVDGARRAAAEVLFTADPRGDAADRLAHHFARALARRIDDGVVDAKAGEEDPAAAPAATAAAAPAQAPPVPVAPPPATAYLAYNQIAPFLRFAHLTANQAILDAAAAAGGGARRLHIVDLDAAHGVQWPPLLQAIADRADPALGPPEVRITGAGPDRDVLLRTGDRLRAFAASLNLPFRFHPLPLPYTAAQLNRAADPAAGLELHPDETLAVNCVLFLHKLGGEGEIAAFLSWVKSMNPTVVTLAEREEASAVGGGDCPSEDLHRRVAAAMDYYAAVFDALEATVPPGSADRLSVEHEVLGQEIDAVVAPPGRGGGRARGFESWAAAARAAGLSPRPLSAFAVSQARLLLRLHYPSEGYVAEEARGACYLGWQTRPLMSVSSWQ